MCTVNGVAPLTTEQKATDPLRKLSKMECLAMVQGFNELELARMMEDQAARCNSMSRLQKRNFILQQLLSRIQGLSDEDFESAFATFTSMVETLEARRKKSEQNLEKEKAKPKDLIQEVNRKVSQSRGTTI